MPPTKVVITVEVPIAFGARLIAALANNFRYQSTIQSAILDGEGNPTGEFETIANPVTAQQFAAATRIQELKDHVMAYEVPDLAKADRQTRIDEINSTNITVTMTQV